ncbi:glycosyltransferase family 87 protein [Psychromicrobium xiongbiense]|uniref:glycosyltransferase family 87 protein n=1 Tax=Psychromicrobium xiongbiense TaxID=3051184 RepID=UPI0025526413|nr:glycosyltransferase family 87 protein [Psychromicrobium sp. YIM S02556]
MPLRTGWVGVLMLLGLLVLSVWLEFSLADAGRLAWLLPGLNRRSTGADAVLLGGVLLSWLLFALAALQARRVFRRVPRRAAAGIVLLGSLILGLAAASAPPAGSNDSARYAWDGIVQKAGMSPYRYVPLDPTLDPLRPAWLFEPQHRAPQPGEPQTGDSSPSASCPAADFPTGAEVQQGLCTAINRSMVPTIYPPVAELYFLLVRAPLPASVGFVAFQLAGLLLSLLVTAGLLWQRGVPVERAAWWGWSPLVVWEGVNNAHVDLLGAALLLLAVLWLARGRVTASALAFGAAVATKLIPVLAAVGLLYRKPRRFVLLSLATFTVAYLPYLLLSGTAILGYLPGYLSEEGYDAGHPTARFALLSLMFPQQTAVLIGGAIVVLAGIWAWRRVDPAHPWNTQVTYLAVVLLVVSPSYPWYGLLVLPFVLLSGRWEYLAVPVALNVLYFVPRFADALPWSRLVLALTAVFLLAMALLRRRSPALSVELGALHTG